MGLRYHLCSVKASCTVANTKARLRNTSSHTYREVKVSFNTNCTNQGTASIDAFGFASGEVKESPDDSYTTSLQITNILLVKLTDEQYKDALGISASGNSQTRPPGNSISTNSKPIAKQTSQARPEAPTQSKKTEPTVTKETTTKSMSLDELIQLAEKGDAEAQYKLGERWGRPGSSQNYGEALKYYRKAAEQNYTLAQIALATMFFNGSGVTKSSLEAEIWLRKAADSGSAEAYYNLVFLYKDDPKLTQKCTAAVEWLTKAATNGDNEAQNWLGDLYVYGSGVTKDLATAAVWFRKAANQENVKAQTNMGWAYFTGSGVPKDYTEAATWYLKAANMGNGASQETLAQLYFSGKGVPKDSIEAMAWLRKAAEQDLASAQHDIGIQYMNRENKNEGLYWLQKAAEQNDLNSQFDLGRIYSEGLAGVKKDPEIAYNWYEKVAALGYNSALNNILVMAQLNEIKWSSYKKAKELYNQAVKKAKANQK